ncbi:DUF7424 family protein [Atlantibacter hermannii]|uniref:DUF7424 family protein n=1 Tax=Atlantibacter hermannii TaxID=565 RepID=UPI0028A09264|nr:hypothetical protein [Atlantibacter hermannii]
MNRTAFVIAISLLLGGCKIGVRTDLPLSGVLSEGLKDADSDLLVEVASCTSYEDSRQPSDTLLDAQKTVPTVFPDAKYKECFTQKMTSWAIFSIPVVYGRHTGSDLKDDGKLHILSYKDTNGQYIAVEASETLKERVKALTSKSFSSFNPADLIINVRLNNDTGSDKKIDIVSSFINDQPVPLITDSTLQKDQFIELRLSDVTTQAVLLPKQYSQSAVFLRNIH